MATITQNRSLTTNITGIRFAANGDILADYQLLDSNGAFVSQKSLIAKADASAVLDGSTGAVIFNSVPAAFLTAAAAIKTQADSAITSAATAGKIVP